LGSDVVDMNNRQPISTWWNTTHSLLFRQNFEKLYDKQFITLNYSTRVSGTWTAGITTEYANRKWLPNSASYSIFKPKGYEFTSNNPFIPTAEVPCLPKISRLKSTCAPVTILATSTPLIPTAAVTNHLNTRAWILPLPTRSSNVFGSDVGYSLISADINKSDIKPGYFR
jgi:hypothetical protein